ncbi:uncharacterized protein LOC143255280 isoform X2 [Tachypleus tridentatus]|uniref:uncharacterized protein LOC143255280 isoform X2 n=1 Tax=Tachypleus tridentatus TaxID=6853 RepID=UPI003FD1B06B
MNQPLTTCHQCLQLCMKKRIQVKSSEAKFPWWTVIQMQRLSLVTDAIEGKVIYVEVIVCSVTVLLYLSGRGSGLQFSLLLHLNDGW